MNRFFIVSICFLYGFFLLADVKHIELEAGEVTWARQNLPMNALAYVTSGSSTSSVINSRDVNRIQQWVPGLFARACVLPTDEYGVEARFIGLLEWNRIYAISTSGTSPTYSLQITSQSPVSYTGGSQVIEDYVMQYNMGDVFFVWNLAPLYHKFFGMRASVGPSYIYLYDRLDQLLSSATFIKEYNIKSVNNLIGARAYGEFIGTPVPFIWGVRGSIGVYGDLYKQTSTLLQSAPSSQNYQYVVNKSWASTLLQGDIFLGVNLFDTIRVKGGFGGEWINYIGSATRQPGRTCDKGGIYPKNDFVFYGAFVSVEVDAF